MLFGDWRDTRTAIEAAYRKLGREVPNNIPKAEWDLVAAAIAAYEEEAKPTCQCRQPRKLLRHEVIRCLDCKIALCEQCAPEHFWPNGRPKEDHDARRL